MLQVNNSQNTLLMNNNAIVIRLLLVFVPQFEFISTIIECVCCMCVRLLFLQTYIAPAERPSILFKLNFQLLFYTVANDTLILALAQKYFCVDTHICHCEHKYQHAYPIYTYNNVVLKRTEHSIAIDFLSISSPLSLSLSGSLIPFLSNPFLLLVC